MRDEKIAVVGQGVIGLTCAALLRESGFSVDIFSKEDFESTSSMSAGAYWWPHEIYPQERVREWSKQTYEHYLEWSEDLETGVHFENHIRFCIDPDDSAYVRELVGKWEDINGTDRGIPCHEAFEITLPVIDVPTYLVYLKKQVESVGVKFHRREIDSPEELFLDFDLVVNCTGVWARHFVNDEDVFPIRGQIVRVVRPKALRESTRIYQKEDQFTLVLPRSEDVVLGGTAQVGSWDRAPTDEETKLILQRCSRLVPEIADSEILGVAVGLRPGRPEVRLELEQSPTGDAIIHNYGHGGGGFTVAWGCAEETALLAGNYFKIKDLNSISLK